MTDATGRNPPPMVRIFAGNIREFIGYLDAKGTDRNRAGYIHDADSLAGLARGTEIIITGNYRENPRYPAVLQTIMERDMTAIYDPY